MKKHGVTLASTLSCLRFQYSFFLGFSPASLSLWIASIQLFSRFAFLLFFSPSFLLSSCPSFFLSFAFLILFLPSFLSSSPLPSFHPSFLPFCLPASSICLFLSYLIHILASSDLPCFLRSLRTYLTSMGIAVFPVLVMSKLTFFFCSATVVFTELVANSMVAVRRLTKLARDM